MTEKKSNLGVLYGIIGLLSVILLVGAYLIYDLNKDLKTTSTELEENRIYFAQERDSLESELHHIYLSYDSLETDNEKITQEMALQQEKINKLIAIQANDAYKIKMYKREMETLRSVLRSYIVQIDSLNTQNQALIAENVQLKRAEQQLISEKEQLQSEKTQLEEIKNVASALQISDIYVEPINEKNRPRKRIRYISKIRTDFLVRSNTVAQAGEKTIYLRLIRPDGVALGSPELQVITFQEEDLPVSASRTITYENADLPVSIFWTNNGELVPGEYKVELYAEGNYIGNGLFTLE
jgi:FtsZ-binding cell division protein ZapB